MKDAEKTKKQTQTDHKNTYDLKRLKPENDDNKTERIAC